MPFRKRLLSRKQVHGLRCDCLSRLASRKAALTDRIAEIASPAVLASVCLLSILLAGCPDPSPNDPVAAFDADVTSGPAP